MTMEVQDFILSQKDYEKSINGQSSAALKQELLTLEVRRVVHQNKDPKVKAVISQQLEEDWGEKVENEYIAALAAATTPEQRNNLAEEFEGPEISMEESAREFDQLQLTPAERAQEHAEIDRAASELSPWQAEQVEVGSRIRMLELELIARRIKEWSQDEAASALAKPQALSKPAIADVLSKYRSPLKVAIAEQLLKIRRPTYLLVCRGLDKHDRDKLPPGWTKNTNYSLFVQVFTDKSRKHLVESEISKVWTDLRRWNLLPPRSPRVSSSFYSPVTFHSK